VKIINTPQNRRRVARAFSNILREWMTPLRMKLIVRRNAMDADLNVCHSHDFCDANQAMLDAFRRCRLPDPASAERIGEDDAVGLWNSAWNLAKRECFDAGRIPLLRPIEVRAGFVTNKRNERRSYKSIKIRVAFDPEDDKDLARVRDLLRAEAGFGFVLVGFVWGKACK
jgi:hypothetical protein